MTVKQKAILVFLFLLWLGLAVVTLAGRGVTLYNILWVTVAGGIIFVPLIKKWNRKN